MLNCVQPTPAHNQEEKGKKEGNTAVTVPPHHQLTTSPNTSPKPLSYAVRINLYGWIL